MAFSTSLAPFRAPLDVWSLCAAGLVGFLAALVISWITKPAPQGATTSSRSTSPEQLRTNELLEEVERVLRATATVLERQEATRHPLKFYHVSRTGARLHQKENCRHLASAEVDWVVIPAKLEDWLLRLPKNQQVVCGYCRD